MTLIHNTAVRRGGGECPVPACFLWLLGRRWLCACGWILLLQPGWSSLPTPQKEVDQSALHILSPHQGHAASWETASNSPQLCSPQAAQTARCQCKGHQDARALLFLFSLEWHGSFAAEENKRNTPQSTQGLLSTTPQTFFYSHSIARFIFHIIIDKQ